MDLFGDNVQAAVAERLGIPAEDLAAARLLRDAEAGRIVVIPEDGDRAELRSLPELILEDVLGDVFEAIDGEERESALERRERLALEAEAREIRESVRDVPDTEPRPIELPSPETAPISDERLAFYVETGLDDPPRPGELGDDGDSGRRRRDCGGPCAFPWQYDSRGRICGKRSACIRQRGCAPAGGCA